MKEKLSILRLIKWLLIAFMTPVILFFILISSYFYHIAVNYEKTIFKRELPEIKKYYHSLKPEDKNLADNVKKLFVALNQKDFYESSTLLDYLTNINMDFFNNFFFETGFRHRQPLISKAYFNFTKDRRRNFRNWAIAMDRHFTKEEQLVFVLNRPFRHNKQHRSDPKPKIQINSITKLSKLLFNKKLENLNNLELLKLFTVITSQYTYPRKDKDYIKIIHSKSGRYKRQYKSYLKKYIDLYSKKLY